MELKPLPQLIPKKFTPMPFTLPANNPFIAENNLRSDRWARSLEEFKKQKNQKRRAKCCTGIFLVVIFCSIFGIRFSLLQAPKSCFYWFNDLVIDQARKDMVLYQTDIFCTLNLTSSIGTGMFHSVSCPPFDFEDYEIDATLYFPPQQYHGKTFSTPNTSLVIYNLHSPSIYYYYYLGKAKVIPCNVNMSRILLYRNEQKTPTKFKDAQRGHAVAFIMSLAFLIIGIVFTCVYLYLAFC